jgi:hypothetical protein
MVAQHEGCHWTTHLKWLKQGPGMVAHTYNPSYLGGKVRRLLSEGQPGQKCETPSEKQTQSKKTGGPGSSGRAPASLPTKGKALSSSSSTTKEKKEKSWVPVAHICNPSYMGG